MLVSALRRFTADAMPALSRAPGLRRHLESSFLSRVMPVSSRAFSLLLLAAVGASPLLLEASLPHAALAQKSRVKPSKPRAAQGSGNTSKPTKSSTTLFDTSSTSPASSARSYGSTLP